MAFNILQSYEIANCENWIYRYITIGHKENTLSLSSIYSSDPSIYLSIYEDQQAKMSSSLGEWVFSGFVFDWLFRREASPMARARENVREYDEATEGGGVGININIIALIALDRGDARAYDTLQITLRGSAAKRVAQRVSMREEEQREKSAGWLCR